LLIKPDETLESIAKHSGICRRYVSQTLKLALLIREMMCDMPTEWELQRSRWSLNSDK